MPKFTPSDDSAVVPFGKYQGQPIEVLLADQNYLQWVISQPGLMTMLQARHPAVFNIITIGAPATDDSPEHNKLQAMFLERDFQYGFLELAQGESVLAYATRLSRQKDEAESQRLAEQRNRLQNRITELEKNLQEDDQDYPFSGLSYLASWRQQRREHQQKELEQRRQEFVENAFTLIEPHSPVPPKITVEFECGYDVDLKVDYGSENYSRRSWRDERTGQWNYLDFWFKLELKPQIGEDYPRVLRQMKNNRADILVIGSFEFMSCSLEQVRGIFGERKIITLAEIQAVRVRGVWP